MKYHFESKGLWDRYGIEVICYYTSKDGRKGMVAKHFMASEIKEEHKTELINSISGGK